MEEINVVKPLESAKRQLGLPKLNFDKKILIALVVIILLGLTSGFGLYRWKTAGTVRLAGQDVQIVNTPTEEGVKDASTFKDTATGTMQPNDGKITTEGTNILVRGDVSQNVYLTSSVIDLSKYNGKKVQVWGETFQGQKAGWLMDVGRIKVVQ
ncbi:MAG: hypothetical protein M1484_00165 [Patescibacteria group bacterium]|nr:hypothetical protein [Patescibacteria group bacterium]MCL5431495.1 hypothetical protein [Patescibacteria group bacterium]